MRLKLHVNYKIMFYLSFECKYILFIFFCNVMKIKNLKVSKKVMYIFLITSKMSLKLHGIYKIYIFRYLSSVNIIFVFFHLM